MHQYIKCKTAVITTAAYDPSSGESGCDESSSNGSVIRFPIGCGEEEEGDGYSSSGSVIRTSADNGSLHGIAAGTGVDEDDDCSSDGSVVRAPLSQADYDGDADKVQRRPGGGDNPAVRGLGVERQSGHQDGNENGDGPGTAGQAPRHMEMNLLAASKYFGSRSGASDDDRAGTATETSPHVSQKAKENPQVDSARYLLFSDGGVTQLRTGSTLVSDYGILSW